MNKFLKIIQGYGKILILPFKLLLFMLLIFVISLGIVYPLWLFSSTNKYNYSLFVLIFIATFLIFIILYNTVKLIKEHGIKYLFTIKLMPILKWILGFTFILGNYSLYFRNIFLAIFCSIIGVILFGYYKFIYKA